ncbi:hypothetical protein [Streptomyces sp. NPDC052179]|uniref:hypothetical protein n=1 Tax=Streptomyces sp. NPDC052179 TaxID=3155680 RepID=UPI00342C0785
MDPARPAVPGEPIELEPEPRDIYREWTYPFGEIAPGQLIKIMPPDDCHEHLVYQRGFTTRQDVDDPEMPVGVLVMLVRHDGAVSWRSHVVTTDTTREELVADHAQELLRQTNAFRWLPSPQSEWPSNRDPSQPSVETMRVSQLIARLTEIQAVCGDLPVRSYPYAGEDWSPAVPPEPLLDAQGRPFVAIDGQG